MIESIKDYWTECLMGIFVVCLIILVISLLIVSIKEKSQYDKLCARVSNDLSLVNDKEVYEARINLPQDVRDLFIWCSKHGPCKNHPCKVLILKATPYLDKVDALYYKLEIYERGLL